MIVCMQYMCFCRVWASFLVWQWLPHSCGGGGGGVCARFGRLLHFNTQNWLFDYSSMSHKEVSSCRPWLNIDMPSLQILCNWLPLCPWFSSLWSNSHPPNMLSSTCLISFTTFHNRLATESQQDIIVWELASISLVELTMPLRSVSNLSPTRRYTESSATLSSSTHAKWHQGGSCTATASEASMSQWHHEGVNRKQNFTKFGKVSLAGDLE